MPAVSVKGFCLHAAVTDKSPEIKIYIQKNANLSLLGPSGTAAAAATGTTAAATRYSDWLLREGEENH